MQLFPELLFRLGSKPMATEKRSSNRKPESTSTAESSALSDDIAKIVDYLDTQRSRSTERTSSLASDIVSRREDLLERLAKGRSSSMARGVAELARAVPEPVQPVHSNAVARQPVEARRPVEARQPVEERAKPSNAVFSERYHQFCHDLDRLLQSFQERVSGAGPTRH